MPTQVASTSWFVNFLQMSGVEQENIGLVMEKIGGRWGALGHILCDMVAIILLLSIFNSPTHLTLTLSL